MCDINAANPHMLDLKIRFSKVPATDAIVVYIMDLYTNKICPASYSSHSCHEKKQAQQYVRVKR